MDGAERIEWRAGKVLIVIMIVLHFYEDKSHTSAFSPRLTNRYIHQARNNPLETEMGKTKHIYDSDDIAELTNKDSREITVLNRLSNYNYNKKGNALELTKKIKSHLEGYNKKNLEGDPNYNLKEMQVNSENAFQMQKLGSRKDQFSNTNNVRFSQPISCNQIQQNKGKQKRCTKKNSILKEKPAKIMERTENSNMACCQRLNRIVAETLKIKNQCKCFDSENNLEQSNIDKFPVSSSRLNNNIVKMQKYPGNLNMENYLKYNNEVKNIVTDLKARESEYEKALQDNEMNNQELINQQLFLDGRMAETNRNKTKTLDFSSINTFQQPINGNNFQGNYLQNRPPNLLKNAKMENTGFVSNFFNENIPNVKNVGKIPLQNYKKSNRKFYTPHDDDMKSIKRVYKEGEDEDDELASRKQITIAKNIQDSTIEEERTADMKDIPNDAHLKEESSIQAPLEVSEFPNTKQFLLTENTNKLVEESTFKTIIRDKFKFVHTESNIKTSFDEDSTTEIIISSNKSKQIYGTVENLKDSYHGLNQISVSRTDSYEQEHGNSMQYGATDFKKTSNFKDTSNSIGSNFEFGNELNEYDKPKLDKTIAKYPNDLVKDGNGIKTEPIQSIYKDNGKDNLPLEDNKYSLVSKLNNQSLHYFNEEQTLTKEDTHTSKENLNDSAQKLRHNLKDKTELETQRKYSTTNSNEDSKYSGEETGHTTILNWIKSTPKLDETPTNIKERDFSDIGERNFRNKNINNLPGIDSDLNFPEKQKNQTDQPEQDNSYSTEISDCNQAKANKSECSDKSHASERNSPEVGGKNFINENFNFSNNNQNYGDVEMKPDTKFLEEQKTLTEKPLQESSSFAEISGCIHSADSTENKSECSDESKTYPNERNSLEIDGANITQEITQNLINDKINGDSEEKPDSNFLEKQKAETDQPLQQNSDPGEVLECNHSTEIKSECSDESQTIIDSRNSPEVFDKIFTDENIHNFIDDQTIDDVGKKSDTMFLEEQKTITKQPSHETSHSTEISDCNHLSDSTENKSECSDQSQTYPDERHFLQVGGADLRNENARNLIDNKIVDDVEEKPVSHFLEEQKTITEEPLHATSQSTELSGCKHSAENKSECSDESQSNPVDRNFLSEVGASFRDENTHNLLDDQTTDGVEEKARPEQPAQENTHTTAISECNHSTDFVENKTQCSDESTVALKKSSESLQIDTDLSARNFDLAKTTPTFHYFSLGAPIRNTTDLVEKDLDERSNVLILSNVLRETVSEEKDYGNIYSVESDGIVNNNMKQTLVPGLNDFLLTTVATAKKGEHFKKPSNSYSDINRTPTLEDLAAVGIEEQTTKNFNDPKNEGGETQLKESTVQLEENPNIYQSDISESNLNYPMYEYLTIGTTIKTEPLSYQAATNIGNVRSDEKNLSQTNSEYQFIKAEDELYDIQTQNTTPKQFKEYLNKNHDKNVSSQKLFPKIEYTKSYNTNSEYTTAASSNVIIDGAISTSGVNDNLSHVIKSETRSKEYILGKENDESMYGRNSYSNKTTESKTNVSTGESFTIGFSTTNSYGLLVKQDTRENDKIKYGSNDPFSFLGNEVNKNETQLETTATTLVDLTTQKVENYSKAFDMATENNAIQIAESEIQLSKVNTESTMILNQIATELTMPKKTFPKTKEETATTLSFYYKTNEDESEKQNETKLVSSNYEDYTSKNIDASNFENYSDIDSLSMQNSIHGQEGMLSHSWEENAKDAQTTEKGISEEMSTNVNAIIIINGIKNSYKVKEQNLQSGKVTNDSLNPYYTPARLADNKAFISSTESVKTENSAPQETIIDKNKNNEENLEMIGRISSDLSDRNKNDQQSVTTKQMLQLTTRNEFNNGSSDAVIEYDTLEQPNNESNELNRDNTYDPNNVRSTDSIPLTHKNATETKFSLLPKNDDVDTNNSITEVVRIYESTNDKKSTSNQFEEIRERKTINTVETSQDDDKIDENLGITNGYVDTSNENYDKSVTNAIDYVENNYTEQPHSQYKNTIFVLSPSTISPNTFLSDKNYKSINESKQFASDYSNSMGPSHSNLSTAVPWNGSYSSYDINVTKSNQTEGFDKNYLPQKMEENEKEIAYYSPETEISNKKENGFNVLQDVYYPNSTTISFINTDKKNIGEGGLLSRSTNFTSQEEVKINDTEKLAKSDDDDEDFNSIRDITFPDTLTTQESSTRQKELLPPINTYDSFNVTTRQEGNDYDFSFRDNDYISNETTPSVNSDVIKELQSKNLHSTPKYENSETPVSIKHYDESNNGDETTMNVDAYPELQTNLDTNNEEESIAPSNIEQNLTKKIYSITSSPLTNDDSINYSSKSNYDSTEQNETNNIESLDFPCLQNCFEGSATTEENNTENPNYLPFEPPSEELNQQRHEEIQTPLSVSRKEESNNLEEGIPAILSVPVWIKIRNFPLLTSPESKFYVENNGRKVEIDLKTNGESSISVIPYNEFMDKLSQKNFYNNKGNDCKEEEAKNENVNKKRSPQKINHDKTNAGCAPNRVDDKNYQIDFQNPNNLNEETSFNKNKLKNLARITDNSEENKLESMLYHPRSNEGSNLNSVERRHFLPGYKINDHKTNEIRYPEDLSAMSPQIKQSQTNRINKILNNNEAKDYDSITPEKNVIEFIYSSLKKLRDVFHS